MTIVNFNGMEYEGDMPLKEFAAKLGVNNGFRVAGDAFRRNISVETYKIEDSEELTAQEIIESC